jgi:trk system potassium uptake protein TrkH
MSAPTVLRLVGLLLAMFSVSMLPPLLVSLIFADGIWQVFLESFAIIVLAGVALWWLFRRARYDLRLRDGFLVVALFWIVLGTFGSAPLLLAESLDLSLTDAIFESVSGLTTTGATVLTGLDTMPASLLFYRQQLQWFGGLGIIVLAVAVLPMLGVGGMQLYRAETPGPMKDSKLTPKITQTAKALWYVYLGITVICAAAYWLAGMTAFDAICHSFSTVAIGGFSTHDASLGYFDSVTIEAVATFFMLVAGVNFALHFLSWQSRDLRIYLSDPELRAYLKILCGTCAIVLIYLWITGYYASPVEAATRGVFQVVSVATTTGFTTAAFDAWPGSLPTLLIFSSFIGGCAGSTAGGMKVVRWLLLYRQGVREIKRLVHPSAEIPVKLGDRAVPPRVVESVWGFFAIYVVVLGTLILILTATGLDSRSAFAAVAATLNNLGPGLGEVANGFGTVSDVAKWASICAMLLGRLEIFTILVLVTPTFWQR